MISYPVGTDFTLEGQALDIENNPVNLTGATVVTMRVYYRPREGRAALVTKTISSGVTVPAGTNGYFSVAMNDDDLAEGEYGFDVRYVLADGSKGLAGRDELDITHVDTES